jgi:hypothetical protein
VQAAQTTERPSALAVLRGLLLLAALPAVPASAAAAITLRGLATALPERFRRRPFGPEVELRALGYGRRDARELAAAGVDVEALRFLLRRGCPPALAKRIVL